MVTREKQISELHSYIEETDNEVTMLLQSLQWDRKNILESSVLVSCTYDPNHKVPPDRKESHEEKCFLRREGYCSDDDFLPEILDANAATVVKLSPQDIQQIIDKAAQLDPSFKRGEGRRAHAPLSAARLQAAYTADERRAVHDAVAAAAPDLLPLGDVQLAGSGAAGGERGRAARAQLLAELRETRKGRAKYRGAAPAARFSHVLRELIKTQMEMITGVPDETSNSNSRFSQNSMERPNQSTTIKQEPPSDDYENNSEHYITERHTERSQSTYRRDPRESRRSRDIISRNEPDDSRGYYERSRNDDKRYDRVYNRHQSKYGRHDEKHREARADIRESEVRVKCEPLSDEEDGEEEVYRRRKKKHKERGSSREGESSKRRRHVDRHDRYDEDDNGRRENDNFSKNKKYEYPRYYETSTSKCKDELNIPGSTYNRGNAIGHSRKHRNENSEDYERDRKRHKHKHKRDRNSEGKLLQ